MPPPPNVMAVLVTAIHGLMCGRPPALSVDPRDEREDDGERG